ncbi:MAG: hypothetical protein PHX08_07910 [Lachnospiraceae bacterium]|nr:hypothetical protein [Lachnospiraceae bacterium]
MVKVNKMDAFSMVVRAMEKNDGKTASEIMKVISKSLNKEKRENKFSEYIEIMDKKDEKYFRELLKKDLQ